MGSACSEVTDERSAFPSRDLTCFPGAALQTGRDSPTLAASPVGKLLLLITVETLVPSLPGARWDSES